MRLVRPFNPLVYPGRPPGFDPSHFAAQGAICPVSAVARLGGAFAGLLNPAPPTFTGAPTTSIMGRLGSVCKFTAGSIFNTFSAGDGTTAVPGYTAAAILSPTATTADGLVIGYLNGGASTGLELRSLQLSTVQSGSGGFPSNSGLSLTAGRFYFIAASISDGSQTWLTLDLATGAVKTATTSGSTGALDSCAQVTIGGGGSLGSNSAIAAAYFAQGVFLGVPQLKAWAQDPWSFWYPPAQQSVMFAGLAAPSGGGGFTAKFRKTFSMVGSGVGKRQSQAV